MVTTGDQFPPNSSKKVLMVFNLPLLSSFELLFLIVISINSMANGLFTAVGHRWAGPSSAGRARKAEMVWKSLERGTGPVQPVLPRKPRPLRPLGLLPLPQGR